MRWCSAPNAQPALQAVINRPRDLTRKGLVELQEWFDRQHFEESSCAARGKRRAIRISPPG
jgi:type I restriction enzyme R subunit